MIVFYILISVTLGTVSVTQSGMEMHVNAIQGFVILFVMVARDQPQVIAFIAETMQN